MNNYRKQLALSFCISLSLASSLVSHTLEAKNTKKNKTARIEMKCYVEMIGGVNTIYRTVLPNNRIVGLAERLVGKKIAVAGAKKKQKIYKVTECVSYKDSFISSKAHLAEQNSAS